MGDGMETKIPKTIRVKLTPEEIVARQRKAYKNWYENLSEDKREKYREMNKMKKGKNKGYCGVCQQDYTNIYQHFKTSKHKKNAENKMNSENEN